MLMDYVQQGGPVMYPLLACSVIALTVVTERLIFWIRMRRAKEPEKVKQLLRLVRQGSYEQACELGRAGHDPILRVLACGVADRALAPNLSMEAQAKEEVARMDRYLVLLDTVITLGPLLGIYGTITGIIRAFGFLSAAGVPDPRLVAAGIAEALITTAAGLTIAIPAIACYNHFVRRMQQVAQEIERHATALELLLQQQRVDGGSRALPAAVGNDAAELSLAGAVEGVGR